MTLLALSQSARRNAALGFNDYPAALIQGSDLVAPKPASTELDVWVFQRVRFACEVAGTFAPNAGRAVSLQRTLLQPVTRYF